MINLQPFLKINTIGSEKLGLALKGDKPIHMGVIIQIEIGIGIEWPDTIRRDLAFFMI